MNSWLAKGTLAVAIALPTLNGTQIPVLGQSMQQQREQEQQGIEGVWDVRITFVRCDTGAAIGTGPRAMIMYIDGGGLTSVSTNSRQVRAWAPGIISASGAIPRSTESSCLTRMAASAEAKQSRETSNSAETATNTQRPLLPRPSNQPII